MCIIDAPSKIYTSAQLLTPILPKRYLHSVKVSSCSKPQTLHKLLGKRTKTWSRASILWNVSAISVNEWMPCSAGWLAGWLADFVWEENTVWLNSWLILRERKILLWLADSGWIRQPNKALVWSRQTGPCGSSYTGLPASQHGPWSEPRWPCFLVASRQALPVSALPPRADTCKCSQTIIPAKNSADDNWAVRAHLCDC